MPATATKRAAVAPARHQPPPAEPDPQPATVEIHRRDGTPVPTAPPAPPDLQPGDRPLDRLGDLLDAERTADQPILITRLEAARLLGVTCDELQLLVDGGAISSTPGTDLLDLAAVLKPRKQRIAYRL